MTLTEERKTARSDSKQPQNMSVGAGLAIGFSWIAASALSIMIMLTACVFTTQPTAAEVAKLDHDGSTLISGIILVVLIALPMIAAFKATRLILSLPKDD